MGNEHSSRSHTSDGIPFVRWKPNHYHFAEPSSYRYNTAPSSVTSNVVHTNPPKADRELTNAAQLFGNIAIIYKEKRVHFPDVICRVVAAGAVGCIFLDTHSDDVDPMATQSLFDGFHSSSRQSISIPIVLLSKHHSDQFIHDRPLRVTIEIFRGEKAISCIHSDHAHNHSADSPSNQSAIHFSDIAVGVAVAARAGEVELLKHLLYSDPSGKALELLPKAVALCDAVENNHVDCVEILHGFGVSLDEQKQNGTCALMVACSLGNLEAARALIMYGAKLDLENVHMLTPLAIAARDNRVMCVKLLIRKGARLNLPEGRTRGITPLHVAARGGFEEIVSLLLEAGAAVDVESPNSTTALMEAARAGHFGCVRILVNHGANIHAVDHENQTAQTLAKSSNYPEIAYFLQEQTESSSIKDHRRRLDEIVTSETATLSDLIELFQFSNTITVDTLLRELTQDPKSVQWLLLPHNVFQSFALVTQSPVSTQPPTSKQAKPHTQNKTQTHIQNDPFYGPYKVQYFCCELILFYNRRIFESKSSSQSEFDIKVSFGYFKSFFHFLSRSEPIDPVLLVLICKILNHYIFKLRLGLLLIRFLAQNEGSLISHFIGHIGCDSIRDALLWILYSDMSKTSQNYIEESKILYCALERLYSWQKTLSWGVMSQYQRDSVENICLFLNSIINPPSIHVMDDLATFVYDSDQSLPLITDQYYPDRHNGLLELLLRTLLSSEATVKAMLELGYAELKRQSGNCELPLFECGALSVIMRLMSFCGYNKRRRDYTGVETLVLEIRDAIISALKPMIERFCCLFKECTEISVKGLLFMHFVAFFRRCVLLQSSIIDDQLAATGFIPVLLNCYRVQPNNSLLHHELTDLIRFVLLDPDQKRLPTCGLLNALFNQDRSLLDLVIDSFQQNAGYKGHMLTIANSIHTLATTPAYKGQTPQISCQEIVCRYTASHSAWLAFQPELSAQNNIRMQPLGERNAPLCDGCLQLKAFANEYVPEVLGNDVTVSRYLESIFSEPSKHECKVNHSDSFTAGLLYKKDKMHDHIPIPEPNSVNSFVQFPVPMPFHALTFTITFVGICRKCGKLWYCDTLQSPNWSNRVKWVLPTSVNKWYSFGFTEGPGSGAHGIQFATKGYKSFIVLCATWGRQEQWMQALQEAITVMSISANRKMDAENAMAIDIDNEADVDRWSLNRNVGLRPSPIRIPIETGKKPVRSVSALEMASMGKQSAPKSLPFFHGKNEKPKAKPKAKSFLNVSEID